MTLYNYNEHTSLPLIVFSPLLLEDDDFCRPAVFGDSSSNPHHLVAMITQVTSHQRVHV